MSCLREEDLASYLYAEMPPQEREEATAHLRQCPACRSALEELHSARQVLAAWPPAHSPARLSFVAAPARTRWRWPLAGLAAAAALFLLLGLSGFQARLHAGRLELGFAGEAAPGEAPSLTRTQLLQVQEETLEAVAGLLRESEARQRQDLLRLASELERQRQQDLHYLARGLYEVDWNARARLHRSEQALQQLVPTVQYQTP